jgi:hypothetical protein
LSLKAPNGGRRGELVAKRWRFHAEHPNWKSDIRWVSAADEATFCGLFLPLFDKLRVAERFRFLGCEMVMFSGFFVLRRETHKSHFRTCYGRHAGSRLSCCFAGAVTYECRCSRRGGQIRTLETRAAAPSP